MHIGSARHQAAKHGTNRLKVDNFERGLNIPAANVLSEGVAQCRVPSSSECRVTAGGPPELELGLEEGAAAAVSNCTTLAKFRFNRTSIACEE
jgi:hypothetical protein